MYLHVPVLHFTVNRRRYKFLSIILAPWLSTRITTPISFAHHRLKMEFDLWKWNSANILPRVSCSSNRVGFSAVTGHCVQWDQIPVKPGYCRTLGGVLHEYTDDDCRSHQSALAISSLVDVVFKVTDISPSSHIHRTTSSLPSANLVELDKIP